MERFGSVFLRKQSLRTLVICWWCLLIVAGCGTRTVVVEPTVAPAAMELPSTATPLPATPLAVPSAEVPTAAVLALSAAGWQMERLNEDYAGAYDQYTAALERDPGYAEGWLRRAIVGLRLGRSDAATDLERGLALNPPAHLADFYRARYERDSAQKLVLYTQAIAAEPAFVPAYISRAAILVSLERYAEAAADLAAVTAIDPLDREVPFFQARIAQAEGDFAAALQGFSTAIERTADYGLAYYERGLLHTQLRTDPARAVADLEQASRLMPQRGRVECSLAEARWLAGDVDGALAAFERAIAVEPEYACSYLKRAELLISLDRYAEALVDLDAYLVREQSMAALLTRSALHARLGDLEAAAQDTETAMMMYPQSGVPLYQYAELQVAAGETQAAREYYERALLRFRQQGLTEQAAAVEQRMRELGLSRDDA